MIEYQRELREMPALDIIRIETTTGSTPGYTLTRLTVTLVNGGARDHGHP